MVAATHMATVMICWARVTGQSPPFFLQRAAQGGKSRQNADHGGDQEVIRAEEEQATDTGEESHPFAGMALFLEPLLHEDDNEHGGHDKIQSLGIEADQAAQHAAQGGAARPVELIEQCDEEVEPAAVDTLGNLGGVVNAEGLIAHTKDEVGLFPAQSLEFIQHGDAIKEVACLYHQCHQKALQRGVGRQQHTDGDKFQTAAVNGKAHQQGIPKAETGDIHINAVGHAQKAEPRKDGNGVGKCRTECGGNGLSPDWRAGGRIGDGCGCERVVHRDKFLVKITVPLF